MKPGRQTVIHLVAVQAQAPAKPEMGQPCNGCGVCCALEPCPLGMLVSRRRQGQCRALQWSEVERRYHCAMVAAPASIWTWLPRWASPWVSGQARRLISAASGCDAALEALRPPHH